MNLQSRLQAAELARLRAERDALADACNGLLWVLDRLVDRGVAVGDWEEIEIARAALDAARRTRPAASP